MVISGTATNSSEKLGTTELINKNSCKTHDIKIKSFAQIINYGIF